MRILPISYNIFAKQLTTKPQQLPILSQALPSDSVEVSFQGSLSYLLPLNNVEGIHCPNCGTKMLTEESYADLVKKAGEIESTKDFVELLREYKDYVPKNMRSILRYVERPINLDNKEFKEFFAEAAKRANYRHRNHVSIANTYLQALGEKLPENDQKLLNDAISSISPTEKSYYYRARLYPLIKSFESLSAEDLFLATKRAFAYVRNSCDYYNVFRIPEAAVMPVPELSQEMVRRLFGFSVQNHTKISQTLPEGWVNNEILVCKRCNDNSTKNLFVTYNSMDNVEFDSNLRTYLTDLAYLMGKEELPYNKSYISNLFNIISKCSKGKFNYSDIDVREIMRISRIASRHVEFEPIVQTKVDVPCAGCSSTLLPHDIKKEIEKALLYCNTTKDYMDVIFQYDKYVGEYSNELVDIMYGVFAKNPDVQISDFYKQVMRRFKHKLNNDTVEALQRYKKGRKYLVNKGSLKQLQTFDSIHKKIHKYVNSGKFNDYNYKNLVEECLKGIDLDNDCTKITYVFLEDLKKIAYKYNITQPNLLSGRTDKNLLHTTLFNIFKSSVATADHLEAQALGGSADIANMVGLCKGCNNLKGRKSINSWFNQNLSVRKSFDKHLLVVDEMAKNGIITGYDNWAKTIADKVYKQTYGKFDMRYLFDEFGEGYESK